MAMLYTHSIVNQLYNMTVVFKVRNSIPSVRYSSFFNVVRLWRISLIPTCRVYGLYDDMHVYTPYVHNTYAHTNKLKLPFLVGTNVCSLYVFTQKCNVGILVVVGLNTCMWPL